MKAKSQFRAQSTANNVLISVPVPSDASAPVFNVSLGTYLFPSLCSSPNYSEGSCKYAPEQDAMVWSIKQFPGMKEPWLRLEYTLPSVRDEAAPDRRPPISIKFEIPYYTVSGIQVRYLKVQSCH